MSKNHYRTFGLEWVTISFVAFNGSGYADRHSPESMVVSYIHYSKWKKRDQGVELGTEHFAELLPVAAKLLEGPGPSQTPTVKNWIKWQTFLHPVTDTIQERLL